MKKTGDNSRNTEIMFLVLLFGVFVICSLMVVLLGARTFEKIEANMNSNYTGRTAAAYITEKIRQNDSQGMISISRIDGKDVLILKKELDEKQYITYIYEDEKYLKELFVKEGQTPEFSYGEKILKIDSFSLEQKEKVFQLSIEDENGNITSCYLHPKTEGQGSRS